MQLSSIIRLASAAVSLQAVLVCAEQSEDHSKIQSTSKPGDAHSSTVPPRSPLMPAGNMYSSGNLSANELKKSSPVLSTPSPTDSNTSQYAHEKVATNNQQHNLPPPYPFTQLKKNDDRVTTSNDFDPTDSQEDKPPVVLPSLESVTSTTGKQPVPPLPTTTQATILPEQPITLPSTVTQPVYPTQSAGGIALTNTGSNPPKDINAESWLTSTSQSRNVRFAVPLVGFPIKFLNSNPGQVYPAIPTGEIPFYATPLIYPPLPEIRGPSMRRPCTIERNSKSSDYKHIQMTCPDTVVAKFLIIGKFNQCAIDSSTKAIIDRVSTLLNDPKGNAIREFVIAIDGKFADLYNCPVQNEWSKLWISGSTPWISAVGSDKHDQETADQESYSKRYENFVHYTGNYVVDVNLKKSSFRVIVLDTITASKDTADWLKKLLQDKQMEKSIIVGYHDIYAYSGNTKRPFMKKIRKVIEAHKSNALAYISAEEADLEHLTSAYVDYIISGGGMSSQISKETEKRTWAKTYKVIKSHGFFEYVYDHDNNKRTVIVHQLASEKDVSSDESKKKPISRKSFFDYFSS